MPVESSTTYVRWPQRELAARTAVANMDMGRLGALYQVLVSPGGAETMRAAIAAEIERRKA